MRHIFKCGACNKYTMNENCSCGGKTTAAKPLKYSPDDKLGVYRRKAKMNDYMQRGLL